VAPDAKTGPAGTDSGWFLAVSAHSVGLHYRATPMPAPHTLSADDVYALSTYTLSLNAAHHLTAGCHATKTEITGSALTNIFSMKPGLVAALTLSIGAAVFAGPAAAQSAVAEGQKLAFDRGKGNCLTCHVIKGGDLPGTIGPELTNIKSKYPDRNELVAILYDETKRNPQTVMPPFGRNRILTDKEINAIVDFLQTL
jgi:sulfur-oxidizing protein SoxX